MVFVTFYKSETSSLFWLVQIKGAKVFEIKRTANCAQILNMLIEKLYRWYLHEYLTLLDLLECDEIWYLSSNGLDLSTLWVVKDETIRSWFKDKFKI